MKNIVLLCFLFTWSISSQTQTENKSPNQILNTEAYDTFQVFDSSIRSDMRTYQSLGLDEKCPNLLDPRIAKDEIKAINNAWLDLNKNIGIFLAKNKFKWESDKPAIKVWHKFYFNKDGTLKKYLFNCMTPVPTESKKEYKKLMLEFAKSYKLPLTRESDFAQCGSAAFQNNS